MSAPFHLALPCKDLEKTRDFYAFVLGGKPGRSNDRWLDIDLFGHQLTFTKSGPFNFDFKNYRLNNELLPSFHFGIILDLDSWGKLYSRLIKKNFEVTTDVTFLENKIGEHISFFIKDPDGYHVEFKHFKNSEEIFQTQD